ncbi:copper amine oxidase N-terminal domain-containing protein [Brevibacillus sp. H7]|uniref:copper amine oxidase N-terminal domain-containing protein n=1 Tax=Brevibacillus sp. H7 TaxID=3349138 RepID=UPI0038090BDE
MKRINAPLLTKKWFLAGVASLLCVGSISPVFAFRENAPHAAISFQIGEKRVNGAGEEYRLSYAPYLKNGSAMFPIRDFAKALHFTLTWNDAKREISIQDRQQKIVLKPNSPFVTINGDRQQMNTSVDIVDGKAYVPIRFIAETLGAHVRWDHQARMVTIDKNDETSLQLTYDFQKGNDGWEAGFADLPQDYADNDYRLQHKVDVIPLPNHATNKGFYLSGMNRSDDLFMYIYKKIGSEQGILPNTAYHITLAFDIATNEAGGAFGIGGAPGESVYVKAGIVAQEPKTQPIDGFYRLNVEKGNQANEGTEMKLLGNVAKTDSVDSSYELKHFVESFDVKSNEKGELYLIMGTDSGYEGLTSIYYTNIQLDIRKEK